MICEIMELEEKAKAAQRSCHNEKRGKKEGSGDFSAVVHMVN